MTRRWSPKLPTLKLIRNRLDPFDKVKTVATETLQLRFNSLPNIRTSPRHGKLGVLRFVSCLNSSSSQA